MARIPTAAACVFCCLLAASAYAQTTPVSAPPPPPANLAFVEGSVDVVHEGVVERADPPSLLVDGDSVRTAQGRAEIVFADGTLLHLDRDANLDILAPDRVRLLAGRVIVRVSAAATRAYFVDTPAATRAARCARRVHRQRGESGGQRPRSQHRARQRGNRRRLAARGGARRRVGVAGGARCASGVPHLQFRPLGWLSRSGPTSVRTASRRRIPRRSCRWSFAPTAPSSISTAAGTPSRRTGKCGCPRSASRWRPYYEGSWGYTRYGWTWYGRDRWAWPTHHYGRWGFNGASWFWIPTNVWGPAWVSWGSYGRIRELVAARLRRSAVDRFLAAARSSGVPAGLQPVAWLDGGAARPLRRTAPPDSRVCDRRQPSR